MTKNASLKWWLLAIESKGQVILYYINEQINYLYIPPTYKMYVYVYMYVCVYTLHASDLDVYNNSENLQCIASVFINHEKEKE